MQTAPFPYLFFNISAFVNHCSVTLVPD